MTSFTSGDITRDGPEGNNCEMSILSSVKYSYNRKLVENVAFTKNATNKSQNKFSPLSKGMMEVCLGSSGGCKWSFNANDDENGNNISLEVIGLESVVKAIHLSAGKLASSTENFIRISRDKGAVVSKIGNGTISIRQTDDTNNLTTVTIIDTKRKVILGSSVYGDNNTLKSKVICKYKGVFTDLKLHTMSLLVFEHDMGDKSGWVTEAIACYQN